MTIIIATFKFIIIINCDLLFTYYYSVLLSALYLFNSYLYIIKMMHSLSEDFSFQAWAKGLLLSPAMIIIQAIINRPTIINMQSELYGGGEGAVVISVSLLLIQPKQTKRKP